MKLDIEGTGLHSIWRLHHIASIEELIKHERRTSREVFEGIIGDVKISRASVINFLNELVELGLATFEERSGKGGYHRVYSLVERSWSGFNDVVIDKFLYKLWEIFPSSEKLKLVSA